MSSPKHRLESLLKKAKRLRRLDGSVVRDVIATTRELLEAQRAQSQFPVATLYCNWSLHNQISGSFTALRCLETVTKRLKSVTGPSANVDSFLQFLSEQVFQVDSLRNELNIIARHYDLPDYLFSADQNWALFVALLLEGLVGKQLQYPSGADIPADPADSDLLRKAKRLYGELHSMAKGERRQIFKAAWITLTVDPWDDRPEPQRTPVFHCNLQAFDGPTFVIRITNAAPLPEADAYALSV